MSEKVDCPYCGYENDMTDFLIDSAEDTEGDWECQNDKCEKEFEVSVEFDPVFYANEIEYKTCEKCGKNERDFYEKGRVFPFPKHVEATILCKTCWRKGVSEELEKETT